MSFCPINCAVGNTVFSPASDFSAARTHPLTPSQACDTAPHQPLLNRLPTRIHIKIYQWTQHMANSIIIPMSVRSMSYLDSPVLIEPLNTYFYLKVHVWAFKRVVNGLSNRNLRLLMSCQSLTVLCLENPFKKTFGFSLKNVLSVHIFELGIFQQHCQIQV